MIIGVISDTHGLLRPAALNALRGSAVILHAGDVGAPEILPMLQEIAPVHAVRGNVDHGDWAQALPETRWIQLEGVRIFMIHDLNQISARDPEGCAVVISGHTHRPANEARSGTIYFNPGSAGPRRFRLPISIGRLTISGAQVSAAHITLPE